ncbi:MAG: hypothetical protein Q9174_006358, partial [Haloplaca sp. 1 TL-2023]
FTIREELQRPLFPWLHRALPLYSLEMKEELYYLIRQCWNRTEEHQKKLAKTARLQEEADAEIARTGHQSEPRLDVYSDLADSIDRSIGGCAIPASHVIEVGSLTTGEVARYLERVEIKQLILLCAIAMEDNRSDRLRDYIRCVLSKPSAPSLHKNRSPALLASRAGSANGMDSA